MDPRDYDICPKCDGQGWQVNEDKEDAERCSSCKGNGFVPAKKKDKDDKKR